MAGKRLSSQTCVRISFLRKAAKIFKKTKLEEKIEDQKNDHRAAAEITQAKEEGTEKFFCCSESGQRRTEVR